MLQPLLKADALQQKFFEGFLDCNHHKRRVLMLLGPNPSNQLFFKKKLITRNILMRAIALFLKTYIRKKILTSNALQCHVNFWNHTTTPEPQDTQNQWDVCKCSCKQKFQNQNVAAEHVKKYYPNSRQKVSNCFPLLRYGTIYNLCFSKF